MNKKMNVPPSLTAIEMARDILKRNIAGEHVGIFSVCSAHELVIESTLDYAAQTGRLISIQGTCNQFDPGRRGYTKKTPKEFFDGIRELAEAREWNLDKILFAGDHLGTFLFRDETPEIAMRLSIEMTEAFVEAGIGLVHLDPSVAVRGDPNPLPSTLVAERSALMCVAAEKKSREMGFEDTLLYVIGTEVPAPGGSSHEDEAFDGLKLTTPEALEEMIVIHRAAFAKAGLGHVFDQGRVVLAVTQPGMEFGPGEFVHKFDASKAQSLGDALRANRISGDFHSTDYNSVEDLGAGVALGFANLKVGPECTYVMGEAIFALERIEQAFVPEDRQSKLSQSLLVAMEANPKYWKDYCHATNDEELLHFKLHGILDRKRYYWNEDNVKAALDVLFTNIDNLSKNTDTKNALLKKLEQVLPKRAIRFREGKIELKADAIVRDHIQDVLVKYDKACNPTKPAQPKL